MPDGTKIQIEDWKSDYSHIKTLNIAAYPIAKESSDKPFGPRKNKIFRLELEHFDSDNKVLDIFDKLETGKITLKECVVHIYKKEQINYI